MAIDPTRAQIYTSWSDAIKILNEISKFGRGSASTTFLNMYATMIADLRGDFADDENTAMQAIRTALAGTISAENAAAVQRPFLQQFCKSVIGRTDLTTDTQMWDEMYLYFINNAQRVQSRVFTFGTPTAAGGNVGTMQISRLNVDAYNFTIENQHVDSKRALCVLDSNTGTNVGEEVYNVQGQSPGLDALQLSGDPTSALVVGFSADRSLVQNASWSGFDDATNPTALNNWTSLNTLSSSICTIDSTNYFRIAPSDGTSGYALKLVASNIFTQIMNQNGQTLSSSVPYLLAFAWNASVYSAVGTLTIRFGNVSKSVVVNGQSGWQITTIAVAQADWYRQFQSQAVSVQIQWARTSGSILFDDVLLMPGTVRDGSWYWAYPTSATYVPARINDQFTWADNCPESGIIQKWIYRAFNRYLPSSNGSSITWSDPT